MKYILHEHVERRPSFQRKSASFLRQVNIVANAIQITRPGIWPARGSEIEDDPVILVLGSTKFCLANKLGRSKCFTRLIPMKKKGKTLDNLLHA
jgi:hypothetical protein